jgi:hypothetical protein
MALPPKVPPPQFPRQGVYGVSWGQVPIRNLTGTEDLPAGVYGESMFQGPGVMGLDHDGWGGIAGVSYTESGTGVYGECHAPRGYAGSFSGNVHVTGEVNAGEVNAGELNVYGSVDVFGELSATIKHAIVPFPDGSKRLLHCMESPEHWFEDFGSARLTRGRATVKLDADFAKVVTLNGYRVFLTPEGDCQGLYMRKRGSRFEVRELQGGISNVAFSYRIVAKRKDINVTRDSPRLTPSSQCVGAWHPQAAGKRLHARHPQGVRRFPQPSRRMRARSLLS